MADCTPIDDRCPLCGAELEIPPLDLEAKTGPCARCAAKGARTDGETSDYGHSTEAACNAHHNRQMNAHVCKTCGSIIEHFDDHGFTFTFCPACDRKLRDDLVSEREFELREERLVRERGW